MNIFTLSFFLLTFNVLAFAENSYFDGKIPHPVWDSDSSNIGQAEIWFQDWTDYTRLLIKSIKDSSSLEKHPYAKTDYEKEYLNAKNYVKPNYVQLLGNIKWTADQNWSENQLNNFEWHIDRDQNWEYTNKILNGNAKIVNNKLYLQILDHDNKIIDVICRYRKYK